MHPSGISPIPVSSISWSEGHLLSKATLAPTTALAENILVTIPEMLGPFKAWTSSGQWLEQGFESGRERCYDQGWQLILALLETASLHSLALLYSPHWGPCPPVNQPSHPELERHRHL